MFHPWFDNCFVVYKTNDRINLIAVTVYIYIFFFVVMCSDFVFLLVRELSVFGFLRCSSIKVQLEVLAWTKVIHYYIVVLLRVGLADLEARVMVGFVQVFITFSDLGHFYVLHTYIDYIIMNEYQREDKTKIMDRKERVH